MVSVVGNDAGTVLHSDGELGTSTDRVILGPENVKPPTLPSVANTVANDSCAGTSGTNEPQNDSDSDEQQPQCSCQQKTEQERESVSADTTAVENSGPIVEELPANADLCAETSSETLLPSESLLFKVNCNRTESDHSRKGTEDGTACQENHHRSCTTAQANCSASSSAHPSASMPADSVQMCGSLRRPNVSYALAARSNLTRRAASAEENPSSSVPTTSESSKLPQTAPSIPVRQKLAKQMTVDETCSPIFVGPPDDDYLQPIANTSSQARPCSALKEPQAGLRPASVDILRRPNGVSTPSEDRPRSVDVVVSSATAAKPLRIPVPKDMVAQDMKSAKRKLSKSRTRAPPLFATQFDESDNNTVSVASANHRTPSGLPAQCRPQPISVNLPDETDEIRPTRELLPERIPGAPTVVRVEKHPYAGTVPSRARQLVRSLAMCGDDDTRLRPPPPQLMNTYASVASVGVPPRFHRNSSSLSRESSYTDYTSDLTEMELRAFIAATLHKNARDRAMILELEQLFTDFVGDFSEQSMKLPPVSSYNRMLIHRVAVLFGLDHNVDNSGKCVVVSKTSKTRAPDFPFASLIQSNIYTDSRRFGPNYLNYSEVGVMDAMQRRAQSFETGYIYPSADPDLINPPHPWTLANQRSFEKQPHYSYQMGAVDHCTMMRKAGSFSGVPAIYRSGSGSFENFDRSQMKPGQSHSLASSSHLSPREPIDETAERFNNASLSDRASQISYRSSGSNPPPHQPVYQPYPQILPYPVSEEVMYPTYQQQVYMQPTTMVTPTSVEMYQPHPAIVMPVQQNSPSVQQPVPVMQCQPTEQLSQVSQTPLEPSGQMVSAQPEYINYPAQQYPAQVITCTTQQYQTVPHTPTYQAQYQHVVYPQQVVQQPLMQAQQYQATFVQAPVQQQYQPPVVQTPVQQSYVPHQPMVHVQSPVYQQSPQVRQQYPVSSPMIPQQYVEVNKNEQQQPNPYQPIVYGQWVPPSTENYQEAGGEAEAVGSNVEAEQSDAQIACAPLPVPLQTRIGQTKYTGPGTVRGKTSLTPLSVLVNPEPMYHYSQTSPVMSSMQQQQMLQIQCHTRPLLYRPSQQYTAQQPSVDGGYCSMSMTQDSLRESDMGTADAQ